VGQVLEEARPAAAEDVAQAVESQPEPESEPEPEPTLGLASESEPEDEIPLEYRVPEYRVPATAAGRNVEFWRPGPGGIAIRVVAYTAALSWPFLGTLIEYKTLNDSGAESDVCSYNGCVALGTEFASQAGPWLVPLSAASALMVFGVSRAVRAAHERVREPEDEKPVPRIVLAGMFVGVCALAFVVGVLRGVMIDDVGR
jgi:hypothetical protein